MKTTNEHNGLSVRTLLTVAGLIVLFFLAGHLWDTYASSASVVKTNVPVTEKAPAGVRFAKIQEIQVGERAIGKNPEIDDEDRRSFFPDPDPATWRKLTLEMLKPDGKRLDITLLRPLTWLEESSAEPGATIYLDLAELGAQGNAKVITVEPCPPIKPGKGNVVTGTFHHEAANTIDLYVDGVEKPIGTTDNHPFWSVTKQEFVEAGKLLPGEELQLHSGQTAKVVQLLPRPGPERVHNLEVLNEHVYRVAHEGVLVHNSYELQAYGGPGGGHHIFMKSAFPGSGKYDLNKALCLTNADMAKLNIDHNKVSAAQHRMCNELTPSTNTFAAQKKIAIDSLVEGGCDPTIAKKIVRQAEIQMKGEFGVTAPTHLPWD